MEQRIEIINNWNLQKVFNQLENGNMKIPRFQRGYVWERSKIVKLLNSIQSQYPIGSFFVWEAGKEYKNFCREIKDLNLPEEPESNYYSFILDGQQRITSLYVALKGKTINKTDYSSICYNVEKKIFHIPRLKNESHNIPAWKLFHTQEYGNILTDYAIHDRENGTKYSEVWRDCQQIFSDYPISIIKTLKMELDEVVTIFERINQGGKRLSLFDLVHASAWSPSFDLRDKIKTFNSEPNVKAFGGVENEVFIQSLSLNAFGDCKNKNQLNLTAEICEEYWIKTTEAIRLSLDFVKIFGVKFIGYLPYNAFLPILQFYYFKSGKKSIATNHFNYIENWFWTATFSARFSSSSLTKMKDDADWISNLSQNILEENVFGVSLTIKELTKVNMQTKSVIKNGVICLMALENPKDFDNSILVTLDKSNIAKSNGKENHHFFPYSLRDKFGTTVKGINALLNFALISGRLNRKISNDFPSDYLAEYAAQNQNLEVDLASHFISLAALEAAQNNNFELFINERAKTILPKIIEKVKVGEFSELDNEIIEENIE
ncbi:DUF262 domain-containing protein [Kordia algicida OT-1]|uniref:GmrSD restriction endonucleases N-terminal domain-containing protein n=1 Tax=Kordia algicida OT-1 TaxID=391587 RepID=A9E5D4_9FLAO|nr:DUF262 domain-containing protein [Kordia algicida]EDP95167.1 hypothetical protein KAOT1_06777 [Kordia algicida OT-1]